MEKSQEFKINYQTKKILFDVEILPYRPTKSVFAVYFGETSLDIYRIYFGKQIPDKGFIFI
jgi:hypothetical protein